MCVSFSLLRCKACNQIISGGRFSGSPRVFLLSPVTATPSARLLASSQDLESEDVAGWQSFDLTDYATELVTGIAIVVQGRGSGAPGFAMLDANIMGTQTDNPTDTVYVSLNSLGC